MYTRFILLIPACIALSFSQEEQPPNAPPKDQPVNPIKPNLIRLDDTRYQLGEVIFDRKTREIRFPAEVHITDKPTEYAIVHPRGSEHEAIITTKISPVELNLAFTLLRYKPSVELFSLIEETGHPTGIYPQVPAAIRAAAHIDIDLEWTEKDTLRRVHLSQCLESDRTNKPMADGPWLYTGEDFGGDIVGMRLNCYAMINDLGPDRDEEGGWHPAPNILPPVGTNLTVIISRYTKAIPLQQY